jgi:transcriptional regulator with XRE-family HTH domain
VFAERIRAERVRLGITQTQAADRLGIRRGTYAQLETTANPQASTLIGLVRELGMDPGALVPELFKHQA